MRSGHPEQCGPIAAAFFGITRALWKTIPSIEANIFDPIRAIGNLRIYSHLYAKDFIDNRRSGENGAMNVEEHKLLRSDWLCLETPDACLNSADFKEISQFGDRFVDNYQSLQNLWHQLNSLAAVTQAMLHDGIETCVFCRPDLLYKDSLGPRLIRAVKANRPTSHVPYWQRYGGENDRFAICVGRRAIAAYGERIELAREFCSRFSSPLHGEELLAFSLATRKIRVRRFALRANRVRLGGRVLDERFERPFVFRVRNMLNGLTKTHSRAP